MLTVRRCCWTLRLGDNRKDRLERLMYYNICIIRISIQTCVDFSYLPKALVYFIVANRLRFRNKLTTHSFELESVLLRILCTKVSCGSIFQKPLLQTPPEKVSPSTCWPNLWAIAPKNAHASVSTRPVAERLFAE
jgi:hypothetical protein